MSDTPMKLIVDCATGAQTYVPLSEEEIAERELMAAQAATLIPFDVIPLTTKDSIQAD